MQITVTNGTLTQIQETLSAASGYVLPDSITVTGATSSYDNSTGVVTLTSLTDIMSITAEGEQEQEDNKITFGDLTISSMSLGNLKVIKMSLGNIDIYSDEEPTVAYSVTITASGNWTSENVGYVLLYDGQDEATGAPLLEQNPASKAAFPQILSVESGYLYFRIGGNFVSGYDMTSNEYTIPAHGSSASQFSGVIPITGNGTINIQVGDFDD